MISIAATQVSTTNAVCERRTSPVPSWHTQSWRQYKSAKKIGAVTIGFTNEDGGKMKKRVDHCLTVPSRDTQRVQECHIAVGHVLCECIEDLLF